MNCILSKKAIFSSSKPVLKTGVNKTKLASKNSSSQDYFGLKVKTNQNVLLEHHG